MTFENTHDIIISGGGMVGLALAVAVAQDGLRVAVIEKSVIEQTDPNSTGFAPRVSALNHASERLLRNLGAWDYLPSSRVSAYSHMHVWDGLGQGEIDFDASDVQKPHLGHIIENRFISSALWSRAQQLSNIEFFNEDEIEHWEQTHVVVTVETRQGHRLQAQVLVGSEGKYSPIRQKSAIDLWSWDYHHTAIVTTVQHERPHQNTASQVFLESGPLAFLPLPATEANTHVSSIVWSVKSDLAESLLALDDATFLNRLNQAFENRYGKLLHADARFAFPLSAQQAKRYYDGRVIVLGDAAHTIHPLAGLGVNLGFLDAATLAGEWQRASAQTLDLGHEFVLRRYQRQRQLHNLSVGALMETLKRLFDTQAPLPVLMRNTGLQVFNNSRLLKRPLIQGALGDFGTPLPELCRL